MKNTKRVSFDVPIEEHVFLKVECAKSHIALRDFLQEMFHKTVADIKKRKFHEMLLKGIQDAHEGKGEYLGSFAEYAIDDEDDKE